MNDPANIRVQCVLTFLSVESKLREHLLADIAPDWETRLCLVKVAAIDFEELRALADLTGPQFNVLRWQHGLESLAKCKDIEDKTDFRLSDLGMLLLLEGGSWRLHKLRRNFALDLFRLQELRNDCFELNGKFNAAHGQEILSHLQEFVEQGSRLLPALQLFAPIELVRVAA